MSLTSLIWATATNQRCWSCPEFPCTISITSNIYLPFPLHFGGLQCSIVNKGWTKKTITSPLQQYCSKIHTIGFFLLTLFGWLEIELCRFALNWSVKSKTGRNVMNFPLRYLHFCSFLVTCTSALLVSQPTFLTSESHWRGPTQFYSHYSIYSIIHS